MRSVDGHKTARDTRSRSFPALLYVLMGGTGLVIVALLTIPVLDGPHSRQYANEASAVSKLREVMTAEKKFAAANEGKGFTCELSLLERPVSEKTDGYDPLWFAATGRSSGYEFVLVNCRTDGKGVVVHYEATAVPIEHGRTGFRAFCTDDSGLLWYDADGSATKCLASRRPL
jgi:hypothetical protein